MNPVLCTEELQFRFGSRTVVRDLSLRLERGDIFGFVGPNGAGKTTTIKMLLGLLTPARGTIRVFGLELRKRRIEILRRIGALVETPSLYPHLTGEENLGLQQLAHGSPRHGIEPMLQQMGLLEARHRRVREYSLGMKQRLGMAMALLHQPELLILDEPTNGLDPNGIQELRTLLRELARQQGITVFLSSHILAELEQIVTKVAVIVEGALRYQGTLEELKMRRPGTLRIQVDDAQRARSLLRDCGWPTEADGDGRLALPVAAKEQIAAINVQLVQAGCAVYQLAFEQPSLERIFVEMTTAQQREYPS